MKPLHADQATMRKSHHAHVKASFYIYGNQDLQCFNILHILLEKQTRVFKALLASNEQYNTEMGKAIASRGSIGS